MLQHDGKVLVVVLIIVIDVEYCAAGNRKSRVQTSLKEGRIQSQDDSVTMQVVGSAFENDVGVLWIVVDGTIASIYQYRMQMGKCLLYLWSPLMNPS